MWQDNWIKKCVKKLYKIISRPLKYLQSDPNLALSK